MEVSNVEKDLIKPKFGTEFNNVEYEKIIKDIKEYIEYNKIIKDTQKRKVFIEKMYKKELFQWNKIKINGVNLSKNVSRKDINKRK